MRPEEQSVDPRVCLIHGRVKVKRVAEGTGWAGSSIAGVSWWECPTCNAAISAAFSPAPPRAPTEIDR